jgi:hypothetical protein
MKGGVVTNMTLTAKGACLRYYVRVEKGGESTVEDGKLSPTESYKRSRRRGGTDIGRDSSSRSCCLHNSYRR